MPCRPIAVLAAAAALAVPAPASAADACPRTGSSQLSVAITRESRGAEVITRLLVCDPRTGVRRVQARGRARTAGNRAPWGRVIAVAATARRRVAWAEEDNGARQSRAQVFVASASGRLLRRFTARRIRGADLGPLGVALLRDGRLAWIDPGPAGRDAAAVLLEPSRRRAAPTRIAAGGRLEGLAAEDGATLVWTHATLGIQHRDVLTPPRRDGCPVRGRFRTVRSTGTHLVSTAFYAEADVRLTRVCARALGRDPVVLQDGDANTFGNGTNGEVTAIAGTFAVTALRRYSRGGGCVSSTVTAVDLRTGTPRRGGAENDCGRVPAEGDPHAVTPAGVPAWLPRDPAGDVLLSARPDGSIVELDRGPAGSIAELRASGESFAWTSAGAPRSAPAP